MLINAVTHAWVAESYQMLEIILIGIVYIRRTYCLSVIVGPPLHLKKLEENF